MIGKQNKNAVNRNWISKCTIDPNQQSMNYIVWNAKYDDERYYVRILLQYLPLSSQPFYVHNCRSFIAYYDNIVFEQSAHRMSEIWVAKAFGSYYAYCVISIISKIWIIQRIQKQRLTVVPYDASCLWPLIHHEISSHIVPILWSQNWR